MVGKYFQQLFWEFQIEISSKCCISAQNDWNANLKHHALTKSAHTVPSLQCQFSINANKFGRNKIFTSLIYSAKWKEKKTNFSEIGNVKWVKINRFSLKFAYELFPSSSDIQNTYFLCDRVCLLSTHFFTRKSYLPLKCVSVCVCKLKFPHRINYGARTCCVRKTHSF